MFMFYLRNTDRKFLAGSINPDVIVVNQPSGKDAYSLRNPVQTFLLLKLHLFGALENTFRFKRNSCFRTWTTI